MYPKTLKHNPVSPEIEELASKYEHVNNVTIDAIDPTAKIPEHKVCAVRVERFVA